MQKHKMSLFSATMIGLTCMVGSGWLFSPQLAASMSGNYAFLAWILAAIFILCIAYCFSKMFVKYPLRGATARVCSITHNKTFGLPFAFVNWFGIIACVSTEAMATTQYLSPYLGTNIFHHGKLTILGKLIGLILLGLYLLVNFYGVKLLSRINNLVTVLKFLVPIMVIATLLMFHFSAKNFTQTHGNDDWHLSSVWYAILGSGMIYTFNGFQAIGSFASEIKDPSRNIPLALFLSITISAAFYLLLQLAFMGATPTEALVHGWSHLHYSSPMMDLALVLELHLLSILVVANAIVSPSATGYTYLGSSSRMLYAMAKEKQAPKVLDRMCPKYHFSKPSMIVNFLIAVFFLFNSSGWAGLMVVVTIFNLISYMSAPIGMGVTYTDRRHKIFGLVVFVAISLVLLSARSDYVLVAAQSLTILAIVFLVIQGKEKLRETLSCVLPFYVFLWGIYFIKTWYMAVLLSVAFYLLVTCKAFVNFCLSHREPTEKPIKAA